MIFAAVYLEQIPLNGALLSGNFIVKRLTELIHTWQSVVSSLPFCLKFYYHTQNTSFFSRHRRNIDWILFPPAWKQLEDVNTHKQSIVQLLRPNHLLGGPERKAKPKEGLCLSTATNTMDITENQVKSSKPGASQQNICAFCSQFSILTNKEHFANCFAAVYP